MLVEYIVFSRFINREGIDFSDAQNMQPVQVCCYVICFGWVILINYPSWLTYLFFLGVGLGGKFRRSFGVSDEVKFRFLNNIVSALCRVALEFHCNVYTRIRINRWDNISKSQQQMFVSVLDFWLLSNNLQVFEISERWKHHVTFPR